MALPRVRQEDYASTDVAFDFASFRPPGYGFEIPYFDGAPFMLQGASPEYSIFVTTPR